MLCTPLRGGLATGPAICSRPISAAPCLRSARCGNGSHPVIAASITRLRSLVRVVSRRADVTQADNAIVGPGAGDDASAVGVADKDDRAVDPADRCFC